MPAATIVQTITNYIVQTIDQKARDGGHLKKEMKRFRSRKMCNCREIQSTISFFFKSRVCEFDALLNSSIYTTSDSVYILLPFLKSKYIVLKK